MGRGTNADEYLSVGRLLSAAAIALLFAGVLAGQNPAVQIAIDANANRHPINPNIYGVAYGDSTTLADLNSPLNRYGGNNTTRYNWQVNGDNRANDWYFESIGDSSGVAGERGDSFISTSKGASAQAMLTIPMIGWLAKLGSSRSKLSSFSIAKYGAQTGNDWQWFPDAGDGVLASNGQNVTGNDPNDANVLTNSSYQQEWVQHLVSQWGTAASGGLKYYILDNEHSIWQSTHRDVHPVGAKMSEIRGKIVDFGGKIKAVDPTATVVGPEEWGWSGYFYSGYDQQYGSEHGWSNLPDRAANGGWDYLPWLLSQLKQTSTSTGVMYLDVFSVHYYPQGGEFGDDTSAATQQLRNRSTRSLWDPAYVDESWINDKVELIPRLKNWVSTYYYSGTPVAITEYNWGAESHINGATAQADIWGIFGREGVDMATRWTTPDPSTPTYKAMKLYRNYDGNKSSFGDISVSTSVPDPDNVAAFGSLRSADGALTIAVINKYLSGNTPITVALSNFATSGPVQAFQLTSSNSITRLPDLSVSGSQIEATLPAQSVTLLVVPAIGGSLCSYAIAPKSISPSAPAANGVVSITTTAACPWTAASNSAFLSISGDASGSGSGPLAYSVTANSGPMRTGTITIAGQTFTVNQAAPQPSLSLTKTHTGNFAQGQTGATYTLLVTNNGTGPTSGSVSLADTLPPGLTLASMTGTGWACTGNKCTRSDGLGAGSSYPPVTVSVNVSSTAVSRTNVATVSGGGAAGASATDQTFVVPNVPVKAGVWQNAFWVLDRNNNHQYDGPPLDGFFQWGPPGVVPVSGDWNGDGKTKIGLYFQGFWYLDYNGNGIFEPGIDKVYNFGDAGSAPVVGDWSGSGTTKIGIYKAGVFILDLNGNGVYDPGIDPYFGWGPTSGAQPILGDWNGDGRTKVGVFQQGYWALDYNGDGIYEPGIDKFFQWGQPTGVPVVGDWNGSGTTKVGSWSLGQYPGAPNVGQFVLDLNGDGVWEPGSDALFAWGDSNSVPVVGDWNSDGRSKIGVFSNGFWALDTNGDFRFTSGVDATFRFGGCGAQPYPCGQSPVLGRW